MTDAEIVKALEHCADEETDLCKGCPCFVDDCCTGYHNRENFVTMVFDLINRQNAEIERLQKEVDRLSQCVLYHDGQIADAKAEAIKEFANKLKCRSHRFKTIDRIFVDCIPLDYIDNLVKEMVGETDGQADK